VKLTSRAYTSYMASLLVVAVAAIASHEWRSIPGGLKAHVSCIVEVPTGGPPPSASLNPFDARNR
jgi:hypothetical protein